MELWQARIAFEKGLEFGSEWSIQARNLVRVEAQIKAIQKALVVEEGYDWDDLPYCGKIFSSSSLDDLNKHLGEISEMAAMSDLPADAMQSLLASEVSA